MSQLEELKEIREKIERNTCTINDLKNAYQEVNTNSEIVIAKKGDIKHLYYRDIENRTVILEKKLLPYEKNICNFKYHAVFPLDLCIPIFYDEDINRYGQGIIIPRKKKFVMVDDMDLIKMPDTESFYTKGVKENNESCASIVDLEGNVYRMFGYLESDERFKFTLLEQFCFPSCLYQPYGLLVLFNNKPVYADINEYPYIVFDKDTLKKCGNKVKNIEYFIKNFDSNFMEGKKYIKK